MKKINIDKEFSGLIPPLQADEFEQLKANIIADGCRDPLVIWAETGILIDGHNRYRICTENGVEFTTSKKSFEDRDSVLLWIINNQMGRRNLLPIDRVPMMERARVILAGQAKDRQGAESNFAHVKEIIPEHDKGQTRDQLGKQIGISGRTYDALLKVNNIGTPELIEAVRNKDVSAENAEKLATLPKNEQRETVAQGKAEMKARAKEIAESRKKDYVDRPLTKKEYPHSDADNFVDVAISHLEQIRHDDPLKRKALDRLIQWATEYKKKRK